MQGRSGQFIQTDFKDNTGGTNLADSVFRIQDNQAAGGFNFDYTLTGGIRKRLAPGKINSSPDTQLRTLGFGLYSPSSGATKSEIRAAGTKIQLLNTDAPSFTALLTDTTTPTSDVLVSGSTETVNFSQFNNGISNILWAAGGGMTIPYGVVSTTQVTQNGVNAPTGVITPSVQTHNSGIFAAPGKYYYAILYRKRSSQALSNVALDVSATIVNTDDTVTLTWTGALTNLDTTLYDKIYIFRSALNGVEGFTTGDYIAQLDSTATSFVDTGDSIDSPENIARAGNTLFDNSPLPSGTYNAITLFKQRLVVAQNSTVYLSDVNKSESWPTTNVIQVPSAGEITGLAIISFTSPQAQSLDEILVIFKEREMWVVTGSDYTDWALKFIDQVGCPQQSLIVLANGFLGWVDYRGIYLWDGSSKPIYASRMIAPLFAKDGDLDKAKLTLGHAEFFRKENQIIWYLSSKVFGEQKFALKMDLRLTLPQIEQQLTGRNIDAVFIQDSYTFPIYAALSYIPSSGSDEMMVLGDASGYCYFASNAYSEGGADYSFTYPTKALDMGDPNSTKLFHKVIVWVQDLGNWNLTLDYWSNYRVDTQSRSTRALPLSTENGASTALWDVALWDVAYWDAYNPNVVPLVFNLEAGAANSNQGTALQLQFRNDSMNQPITIHGFSVLWSELGGVTA